MKLQIVKNEVCSGRNRDGQRNKTKKFNYLLYVNGVYASTEDRIKDFNYLKNRTQSEILSLFEWVLTRKYSLLSSDDVISRTITIK